MDDTMMLQPELVLLDQTRNCISVASKLGSMVVVVVPSRV
jgi:hypothetical protein